VFDKSIIRGDAGTCVFLPRDIVHTFKNVGNKPGTMLVTTMPGGFHKFGECAAVPCTDPSKPPPIDPALLGKLAQVAGQFGIELKPEWQADELAPPRAQPKEYWVLGNHVRILLGSKATGGQFSVVEGTSAPGTFVPPHLHLRQDEMFYVLEGTYEFELEGRNVAAPAGTFVHVPRGTMHGFANRSDRPARIANYHTPGGFEDFFIEAGTECVNVTKGPPRGQMDTQWLMNVFTKHGMQLGPRH
jgi:quercetin dioxygenase-like cupin family protein